LYTSSWAGVEPTTPVAIGTDCKDSCKSNYHTTSATMVDLQLSLQSVPIATGVVGSTPAQDEVYNIMW
jgi:hypothetical protein